MRWVYGALSYIRVPSKSFLTHWGRVTHICVSDLTIISSDNGLSPGRRQAIIGTNAGILLMRPLGTNFSEILIEILIFLFKKIRVVCEKAAILSRPQCVLRHSHGKMKPCAIFRVLEMRLDAAFLWDLITTRTAQQWKWCHGCRASLPLWAQYWQAGILCN